jgi:hypothetical protein
MEIIIDIMHPVPYIEGDFIKIKVIGSKIRYRFQTFLYSLMFFKIYNVLKVLAAYSGYSNSFSERYCEEYGTEADNVFALKAVQKDRPFLILIVLFISFSIVLGILLRMYEMYIIFYIRLHFSDPPQDSDGIKAYQFYTNGIWNVIIAMTTSNLN